MSASLQDQLLQRFAVYEGSLNGSRNNNIHSRRQQAAESFRKLGFPTSHNEEWKYTDLKGVLAHPWQVESHNTSSDTSFQDVSGFLPEGLMSHVLTFINGRFAPEASRALEEEDGIIISSFAKAQKEHTALVEKHFGKYLKHDYNGLAALNTALATEGAFIHIPSDRAAKYPVHLLFLSGSEGQGGLHQYRNLIVAERGASVEVLESTCSMGSGDSFTNIATEVYAGINARVTHYKIQTEGASNHQVNTTQFHQEGSSRCENHTLTLSGAMVRNDLNYTLSDKGCEAYLYGIYVPSKGEHFDNHSFVDHAMPHCYSNELYKGVMAENGTGVFNGKILVRKDAQKTNAYQSNKNILLSKEAKIDTKPQLEIFADDVKCSHGATVGQLDEEALFYLRSRGIGHKEAMALLTQAFAADVLANIPNDAIREWTERLLFGKLATLRLG